MSRPPKPNIRRIAFQQECYKQLESYLHEQEMQLNEKELLLDLAALVDFLEDENYLGAHYLGEVIKQKLNNYLPVWHKLARLHVPKNYTVPVVELDPES